MGHFAIFRMVRLSRLIQVMMRFVSLVEPLWKLVRGFLSSLSMLLWTLVIMCILIYVFACIGVEAISGNGVLNADPTVAEIMETHFNSLGRTMLTLVRFTTGDITRIYFPLIIANPYVAWYFVAAYLVITILLMNLITASLVNNAINQGREDEEMRVKKIKDKLEEFEPQLKKVFSHLDEDGSGDINMKELARFQPEIAGIKLSPEIEEVLKPESLEDTYECFDVDGTGTVSQAEFIQGCLAILTKDTSIWVTQLLQLSRNNMVQLKKILDMLDDQECLRRSLSVKQEVTQLL